MPILLFLGVFLYSGLSPRSNSFDSRWSVYIAMSLWNHGSTYLDDYSRPILADNYYALECVDAQGHVRRGPPEHCDGHWYSSYPVGGPVLAAPLVIAAVGILKLAQPVLGLFHPAHPVLSGFLRADYDFGHPLIELEVASIFLAATAVLIYLIARRFLDQHKAILLTILFAAATPAYSVLGRGLWQHTPSTLFLALTIYLLLGAEERPALAGWAGLPVALSYAVRPTDAIFVLIFTGYVGARHRRYFLHYLVAATPVAILFFAYNFSVYHQPFSPYYQTRLYGFKPEYWPVYGEALAANLISPSRGWFIFTPVFLLSAWSMLRGAWTTPLSRWLAAIAVLQWVAVSGYISNWWAGMCYGPRFLSDLTPIFTLFLIPYFQKWNALSRGLRNAFVALALIGWILNLRGGWSIAVYQWNVDPVSIDKHPERNWDWSDPPFLRWRVKDL